MEQPNDAPTASQATAPAPAVEASQENPRKTGFLASLLGNGARIAELENELNAERAAHATTRTELATAQGRIAEFEALEAQLEQEAAAAQAAATQAQAAAAEVPHRVAAQVAAVVETLGVPESALPAQQATPPAKGEEFAHLKGLDRAAAAINAKFGR